MMNKKSNREIYLIHLEKFVSIYTPAVQTLIDELGKLPGVGPKSAQRIAFHLVKLAEEDAIRLSTAIREAKEKYDFARSAST